jgi:hypothetical protein
MVQQMVEQQRRHDEEIETRDRENRTLRAEVAARDQQVLTLALINQQQKAYIERDLAILSRERQEAAESPKYESRR